MAFILHVPLFCPIAHATRASLARADHEHL